MDGGEAVIIGAQLSVQFRIFVVEIALDGCSRHCEGAGEQERRCEEELEGKHFVGGRCIVVWLRRG